MIEIKKNGMFGDVYLPEVLYTMIAHMFDVDPQERKMVLLPNNEKAIEFIGVLGFDVDNVTREDFPQIRIMPNDSEVRMVLVDSRDKIPTSQLVYDNEYGIVYMQNKYFDKLVESGINTLKGTTEDRLHLLANTDEVMFLESLNVNIPSVLKCDYFTVHRVPDTTKIKELIDINVAPNNQYNDLPDELIGVDPWDETLTKEQQVLITEHCKESPQYYFDHVLKAPPLFNK